MYSPKRIIQIVSGSRSGSSLLKSLLALCPQITSLDGEEEPYFAMSGNGYGLTSESDTFHEVVNPNLFRSFITTELTTITPWEWRLRMQYRGATLARLLNCLDDLSPTDPFKWARTQGIVGHYDGCQPDERAPLKEMVYEMAPLVTPKQKRRVTDTLLLKTPYSVYRYGVTQQLYPNSEIIPIILTRNPAATINGLIDGWQASYGFHKHLTPYGWWKFDLPPRWKEFINATTAEKAWLQWTSSYQEICNIWRGYTVRFEDIINYTQGTLYKLCTYLCVSPPTINGLLPLVMVTETPRPFRWKKRAEEILSLLNRSSELIAELGYGDDSKWI